MLIFAKGVKKEDLNSKLIRKLDLLERYFEGDLKVTSGLRSIEHNKAVGGSPTSSHLKGLAIDIFCEDGRTYWNIRNKAIWAGFNRIGHGKTHIHLDIDTDKPQNCEWWE